MPGDELTEKTALDLIEQMMILNSNIERLADILSSIEEITVPDPVEEDDDDTTDLGDGNVMRVDTTTYIGDNGMEKKKANYVFVGKKEYDPGRPLPSCFPHLNSEECIGPENCLHGRLCEKHPDNNPEEEDEESAEPKGGFTPRTEKTIIKPAVFDDSELADKPPEEMTDLERDLQELQEEEESPKLTKKQAEMIELGKDLRVLQKGSRGEHDK